MKFLKRKPQRRCDYCGGGLIARNELVKKLPPKGAKDMNIVQTKVRDTCSVCGWQNSELVQYTYSPKDGEPLTYNPDY